jgi:hypothetical protein
MKRYLQYNIVLIVKNVILQRILNSRIPVLFNVNYYHVINKPILNFKSQMNHFQ